MEVIFDSQEFKSENKIFRFYDDSQESEIDWDWHIREEEKRNRENKKEKTSTTDESNKKEEEKKKIVFKSNETKFFKKRSSGLSLSEIEAQKTECFKKNMNHIEKRRECNRIASARSRKLREIRIENNKKYITQLQEDIKCLMNQQSKILDSVNILSEFVNKGMIEKSRRLNETLDKMTDIMEETENIVSEINSSEAMNYKIMDVEKPRRPRGRNL